MTEDKLTHEIRHQLIEERHWDIEDKQWEAQREQWQNEKRYWKWQNGLLAIIGILGLITLMLQYYTSTIR